LTKMSDEEEIIDFGKKKKKERKTKKDKEERTSNKTSTKEEDVQLVNTEFEEGQLFEYDELLQRVHDIIEAKHSGLGVKEKYTLQPPQIARVGAKKTGWVNFVSICESMKRSPDHLMAYVFAELGVDGTMAGEGQFILKGRFYPRNIESLLRKYIREYVMCGMCRSTDTELLKDQATRLHNIKCRNCHATKSCASIKSGFHAMAKGDRKKAKQADHNIQVVG